MQIGDKIKIIKSLNGEPQWVGLTYTVKDVYMGNPTVDLNESRGNGGRYNSSFTVPSGYWKPANADSEYF